jgi:hypothetical protein
MSSAFDPIHSARALRASNLNHSTIPIVDKIRTQSLGEFLPELWDELQQMPPYARFVANYIWEQIRRKCESSCVSSVR